MRTGNSIKIEINTISRKALVQFSFTEQEADTILKARRVLPYTEDSTIPAIDAEKLWARLGKPHGRFRNWMDYHLKPMLTENLGAEISASNSIVRGKPKAGYLLSRNVASHLAMMAKTQEGSTVRDYFILMERVALRVMKHNILRGDKIIQQDNRLVHATRKQYGHEGTEVQKQAASLICHVLTGLRAGAIREIHGKGIRDLIAANTADLQKYTDAQAVAVQMIERGKELHEVRDTLMNIYDGAIDLGKYAA